MDTQNSGNKTADMKPSEIAKILKMRENLDAIADKLAKRGGVELGDGNGTATDQLRAAASCLECILQYYL